MKQPKQKKTKEASNMTTMNKPSVFEIKTTKENFDEVMKALHEPRITVEFLRECKKTADKLRKEKE